MQIDNTIVEAVSRANNEQDVRVQEQARWVYALSVARVWQRRNRKAFNKLVDVALDQLYIRDTYDMSPDQLREKASYYARKGDGYKCTVYVKAAINNGRN